LFRKIRALLMVVLHPDESFENLNLSRCQPTTRSAFDKALDQWLDSLSLSSTPRSLDSPRTPVESPHSDRGAFEEQFWVRKGIWIIGRLSKKRAQRWKKRIFILDTEKGVFLEYSQGIPDLNVIDFPFLSQTKPASSLDLRVCSVKKDINIPGNCFLVVENFSKELYLQAETEALANKWVSKLLQYTKIVEMRNLRIEVFYQPVLILKPSGKIIDINEAALEYFKYKKEIVVGKNVKLLIPECPPLDEFAKDEIQSLVTTTATGESQLSVVKIGTFSQAKVVRYLLTLAVSKNRELRKLRAKSTALERAKSNPFPVTNLYTDTDYSPPSTVCPVGFLSLLS